MVVKLCIYGKGEVDIDTGIKFFDHLLGALAKHACFNLNIRAKQHKAIDEHHIIEDVAIVLGRALDLALGDRKGIRRFGHAIVPMDEALAMVAVDMCGRIYSATELSFKNTKIGDMPTDLIKHFISSFSANGKFVVHAKILSGEDDHHKAEALFKALGVAIFHAVLKEERLSDTIPSQKGVLN